MEESASKYQMITAKWLEQGGEIELPLNLPWPIRLVWEDGKWESIPENGINVFSLMQHAQDSGYRSSFWISLRDGEKAGGSLKPQSEGLHIASWRWRNLDENFKGDLAARVGAVAKQSLPMEKSNVAQGIALRPEVLFNAQQWDGLPALPDCDYQPPTPQKALELTQSIVKDNAPCEIRHQDSGDAFYNPSQNYIQISKPETYPVLSAYYKDLFEQFGHAMAGKHKMNLWDDSELKELAGDMEFRSLYAKMLAAMLVYQSGCELLG